MEAADNLSLILRYTLIGLFFGYYGVALGLSIRLADCDVRKLILRGAYIPLLVAAMIAVSLMWFGRAEGQAVLTAFTVVVGCSVLGAIAFSLWLERAGGKQMLYVPIAFKRFGWHETEAVAYAVSDLSSDEPEFGSNLLLSYLPLAFVAFALALIVWDVSRWVGG